MNVMQKYIIVHQVKLNPKIRMYKVNQMIEYVTEDMFNLIVKVCIVEPQIS